MRTNIYKIYNKDILVDGINVYNEDVVQFRLYTVPSLDSHDTIFHVFPITAGVQFFGDYYILNDDDCIGVFTLTDIENMCHGEYVKDPIIFSGYAQSDSFVVDDSQVEISKYTGPVQLTIDDYDEDGDIKEDFRGYDF